VAALRPSLLAAAATAALAFFLYSSTLLPGQDLGDTASFQAIAGDHLLTPRQGYPLYFAIAGLFVHGLPVEAARATNLASAVEASLAVGLLVLVGAQLGGTLVAGLVAALLLAGSYTFWSQAIIAEVYALHLAVLAGWLLSLLTWYKRPSFARLSLCFALFALGFGNHLSMVLLMPALAVFLLVAAPGGPVSMLRPRVVLLAAAIAALFALQYAWNFSFLLRQENYRSLVEQLQAFWFDVTKSDWRANMVYGIPWSTLSDRFAMSWFDVRQQVGLPGVAAAVTGQAFLLRKDWRVGVLTLLLWLVNWVFAFTYNVGDVHVFYLPAHFMVALAAGCGAGWAFLAVTGRLRRARSAHQDGLEPGSPAVASARTDRRPLRYAGQAIVALALLAYPAWRVYDTYPAMDRSDDRSATAFFDALTAGMDTSREILGTDLNWQLHNGFDYYVKYTRPDVSAFDVTETLLYFPLMAWHNLAMRRAVALTDGAAAMVKGAYGDLLAVEADSRVRVRPLAERVAGVPPGTPYLLSVIEPYPESPLDAADLADAVRHLGIGPRGLPTGRFVVVAGRVGEPPAFEAAGERPFRRRAPLAGRTWDVRIECWLPADTIRRAGFGHVVVDRRHVLTLDRGVSFVALAPDGSARLVAWAGGLLAPQPRFVIRPPAPAADQPR
jgi:hypothetical protein